MAEAECGKDARRRDADEKAEQRVEHLVHCEGVDDSHDFAINFFHDSYRYVVDSLKIFNSECA